MGISQGIERNDKTADFSYRCREPLSTGAREGRITSLGFASRLSLALDRAHRASDRNGLVVTDCERTNWRVTSGVTRTRTKSSSQCSGKAFGLDAEGGPEKSATDDANERC